MTSNGLRPAGPHGSPQQLRCATFVDAIRPKRALPHPAKPKNHGEARFRRASQSASQAMPRTAGRPQRQARRGRARTRARRERWRPRAVATRRQAADASASSASHRRTSRMPRCCGRSSSTATASTRRQAALDRAPRPGRRHMEAIARSALTEVHTMSAEAYATRPACDVVEVSVRCTRADIATPIVRDVAPRVLPDRRWRCPPGQRSTPCAPDGSLLPP